MLFILTVYYCYKMKNYYFIGMETGGSSATQNRHGSRRVWTKKEEESLLDILDDVVARGMRCDTGSSSLEQ